jgi:hypothetical protein
MLAYIPYMDPMGLNRIKKTTTKDGDLFMEPPKYKQLLYRWGAFGFEKERRMGPKAI